MKYLKIVGAIFLFISSLNSLAWPKEIRHKPHHKADSGIYGYGLQVDTLTGGGGTSFTPLPHFLVVIKQSHSSHIFRQLYAKASGDFTISLPAGVYEITVIHTGTIDVKFRVGHDWAKSKNNTVTVRLYKGFRTFVVPYFL